MYVDRPVLLSCRDLAAAMERLDEAVCSQLRVGRSDLRALSLLETGPLTATALSRGLGLTRPAVTALVDRLAAAGFVERVAVPGDRRATAVAVQPAAAEAFARAYEPLGARVQAGVDTLPPPQREAVNAVLDVLAGAFRTAHARLAATPDTAPDATPDAAPDAAPSAQAGGS